MMKETRFDSVFDCQQVFKALMHALAQPGKVFSMEQSVEKMGGQNGALAAVAMTLLDNWRSFYVDGDSALEEELRALTYGVPTEAEEADYLFFPRTADPSAYLEKVKSGTLPEPHKSATLFLLTEALDGGIPFSLSGPGVDGEISVCLPSSCKAWIQKRQELEFEFPRGADLCFLTPQGLLMGVPRRVRIGGAD